MENPLISVQINCHNGGQFLHKAISSVYLQTYKNWEIIFWDNASSDQSVKIARSFDQKVKFFSNKEKKNLGEVRDLASRKAKGKYLTFLDCDDEWLPLKLEEQVKLFQSNSKLGLVYGVANIINEKDKDLGLSNIKKIPKGNVFEDLLKENFIIFSSAMVEKKKFFNSGGFPKKFRDSTDYWTFLKIAQKFEIDALDEVCCKCRVHQNNLSNKQRIISVEESILTLKSFLPNKSVEKNLKYHYVSLAIAFLKERKYYSSIITLMRYNLWFLFAIRVYYFSIKFINIKLLKN